MARLPLREGRRRDDGVDGGSAFRRGEPSGGRGRRALGLLEDAAFVTVEEWPKPVSPGLKLRKVGEERVGFLRLEDEFKEVPREVYVEQQGFEIFESGVR
ncbi:MAG: hypothetical protein M3P37_02550 [Actinomycetota bacterium]|nr:hypothetical protein [Actinomycetota bacterium]